MKKSIALLVVLAGSGLIVSGCFKKPEVPQAPVVAEPVVPVVAEPVKSLEKFNVDAVASRVEWRGEKAALTKSHVGTVLVKEGRLDYDGAQLVGGRMVLDMTTIIDEDQEGASKEALEKHLKSADFFDVTVYPTAELIIKSVAASSTASSTNAFVVTGDLTIKGQTHGVELPATITKTASTVEAMATMTIDRTLWGITVLSDKLPEEAGKELVSNNITFNIKLVANSELAVATPMATSTVTTSPTTVSGTVEISPIYVN